MGFYLFLIRTAMRSSLSARGAFLWQAGLMLTNNLIFLVMWIVFFKAFREVGGWKVHDMVALYAVGSGACGLAQVFFGGSKTLARTILTSELEAFMTQPKDLLLYLVCSRSLVRGWGHLLTAPACLLIESFSLQEIVLMSGFMLLGCMIFVATGVLAHSLVFWLGSVERLSKQYCDSLYILTFYPTHIYSTSIQVLMFTLVPAALIGTLPVETLRTFSWGNIAILLAATAAWCALAYTAFYRGLKRYESGNQFC